MYKYILKCVGFVIWAYVVGSGCAAGGQLTGGPKDVAPPRLIEDLSPPVGKTRFYPSTLEFYFDEFVQVKDPVKQVLVSPPLTYLPKVRERGKKVTFEFDQKEILRNDATYTINFGESIVDFREGNKLNNFTYVFSTGDYIDSLSLKGQVINALTNKGDEDIVVFLYDNIQDSVVRTEKPFYFAKPDKNGFFEFRNIKSDTFKIFAINDKNLNYKYDLDNEKIAFPDSLYFLDTTFQKHITLRSSVPVPKRKKLSHDTRTYGQVVIQYNAPVYDSLVVRLSDDAVSFTTDIKHDTLFVYYETTIDSFQLYLPEDTLWIKPANKSKFIKDYPFKSTGRSHQNKIIPGDSLMVFFNFPIRSYNPNLITISDTIGPLEDVKMGLSPNMKILIFKPVWKTGESYKIKIDSSALHSIHGQVNTTLEFNIEALTKDKTATLLISLKEMDSLSTYIFHIMTGDRIIFSDKIQYKVSELYKIENLLPLQYDFEIIEDKNNNGRWDPGNYDTKQQPEFYSKITGGKIRENRDTEVEIIWKNQISALNTEKEQPGLNPIFPTNK